MKLNTVEKALMNNPVRVLVQRRYEARLLERLGGRVDGLRVLEIGCGRGVGTEVIFERFDFNEMAKRSLGQHWQRRSPEEQRQFVQLFTDLLERSYADQIDSFNGEKIIYGREDQDKDRAEVDTKVVSSKGEEYSVNYKLHAAGREWKVYDVVIENISLVNNYRSQFNRVLATANFEELLRKLQGKNFDAPAKEKRKAHGTNLGNSAS